MYDIKDSIPAPGKRCFYIYEGSDGIERMRAGGYNSTKKCFETTYFGHKDKVLMKKVRYWFEIDELNL